MYLLVQWLSYLIFSGIVFGITWLSLLSAMNSGHYVSLVLKALIFLLITFQVFYEGYKLWQKRQEIQTKDFQIKEDIINFISLILGAMLTFFVSAQFGLNAVLVSGFVGLSASILFPKYQIAIYCGSFAGMASGILFGHSGWILVSSLFTALLFVFSREVYSGFGGKLGASAFWGTLITALLAGCYHQTVLELEIVVQWEVILYFVLGAIFTNQLHLFSKKSTVFTSGIFGVIAGILLPIFYPEEGLMLAAALFSGTFIGMTKVERFDKSIYYLLASIFGGIIFIYSQTYFNGLGGKLGAIAFISSLAVASLRQIVGLAMKKAAGK